MTNLLNIIDSNLDGNAWENICVKCYRYRYEDQHYTPIPAVSGGDAGIEGFTKTGIVHQCYFPERQYSDHELYEAQRNKLSTDIKKLLNNGDRLIALGVPVIHEWHFNIPEYRDSKILIHAATKQKEVLSAKANNPNKYSYIADDFQIVIKTAENFSAEISRIIRTSADYNLNLAVEHTPNPDWKDCDSQKVANIRRKIKAIMHVSDDNNPKVERVVGLYIDYYICGLVNVNRLKMNFPDIHAELFKLVQIYKGEVTLRTSMNANSSMNQSLFNELLNEFEQKLEKDFSTSFNQASIVEIKQDMVASWLADCSMEFSE